MVRVPTCRTALAAVLLWTLGSAVAVGQSSLTGLRATVVGTDVLGNVDLDVTIYTDGSPASSVGFLGDEYTATTTFLGYTTNLLFRMLDPEIHAIEWGDGSNLERTTIPFVSAGPPRTFRGSFSHSYPDLSERTIRVGSTGWLGYGDGGATGYDNPRLPPLTGQPLYATAVESYYRVSYVGYPGETIRGTAIYTFPSPFAVALTNTTVAAFPSALEIPTTSHRGLILRVLARAIGGTYLLRS